MWLYLVRLLIYWMAIFVSCFAVTEVAQDQLYDEVTPRAGLKISIGALLLAILMVFLPPSYETMFTSDIAWTLLHLIAWFGVFTLIFQFHPPHALGLSIATFFLISGFATMGVESIVRPSSRPVTTPTKANIPAVRQSLAPKAPPLSTGKVPEKAK
ncbi:MAG: hypothetical protein ABS79_04940 [Planctomycetes bacterium SCN 63-9]|nr:MAG: hypothetical protein ABS79_04940 [Planctomycetes bacterium SCN 63-9]